MSVSLRGAINATCRADGCQAPTATSGLCNAHYIRMRRSGDPNSPRQRGVRGLGTKSTHGYRVVSRRYEHAVVAERALGKSLPPGAQVHHVNGDKLDNRPENLVICPNAAYHGLLHRRGRALAACGHADWIVCGYCGTYDAPENLAPRKSVGGRYHVKCQSLYNLKRLSRGWVRHAVGSANSAHRKTP